MNENRVYQIHVDRVPGLAKLFDVFDSQCKYPSNTELFRLNISTSRHGKRLKEMRDDCERKPDVKKYENIEKKRKVNQQTEKKRKEMKEGMHVQPCDADHCRMSIVCSEKQRYRYGKQMEELRKRYGAQSWFPRGHYFYPANKGFCSWHTNEYDLPGWRMYLIKVSSPEEVIEVSSPEEEKKKDKKVKSSTFTYVNPSTEERIRVCDKNRTAMLFKIPCKKTSSSQLWHNVHSGSFDRWSLGFALDDKFALAILKASSSSC